MKLAALVRKHLAENLPDPGRVMCAIAHCDTPSYLSALLAVLTSQTLRSRVVVVDTGIVSARAICPANVEYHRHPIRAQHPGYAHAAALQIAWELAKDESDFFIGLHTDCLPKNPELFGQLCRLATEHGVVGWRALRRQEMPAEVDHWVGSQCFCLHVPIARALGVQFAFEHTARQYPGRFIDAEAHLNYRLADAGRRPYLLGIDTEAGIDDSWIEHVRGVSYAQSGTPTAEKVALMTRHLRDGAAALRRARQRARMAQDALARDNGSAVEPDAPRSTEPKSGPARPHCAQEAKHEASRRHAGIPLISAIIANRPTYHPVIYWPTPEPYDGVRNYLLPLIELLGLAHSDDLERADAVHVQWHPLVISEPLDRLAGGKPYVTTIHDADRIEQHIDSMRDCRAFIVHHPDLRDLLKSLTQAPIYCFEFACLDVEQPRAKQETIAFFDRPHCDRHHAEAFRWLAPLRFPIRWVLNDYVDVRSLPSVRKCFEAARRYKIDFELDIIESRLDPARSLRACLRALAAYRYRLFTRRDSHAYCSLSLFDAIAAGCVPITSASKSFWAVAGRFPSYEHLSEAPAAILRAHFDYDNYYAKVVEAAAQWTPQRFAELHTGIYREHLNYRGG